MSRGFFIGITRSRRNEPHERWIASCLEPLSGWSSSKGKDFEETIRLQKDQYEQRKTANEPLPYLVHSSDGPMACGKITRFVEVEQ